MSATKAGKRPLRSLTAHEKLNAIKRVSVGGESKASVARDIGVPESTLRGWCKNQEKISYQVRTSPSNIEENAETITLPPAKLMKLEEQPYNLSLKTSDASNGSYSPYSEFESEYRKSSEPESESSPLNLRTTNKSLDSLPPATSTPKVISSISEKDKEKEKNKAELARLSSELGLNRPEVLMSTLNSFNNLTDLTTALLQYKHVYQSWYYQQQQQALSSQTNKTPIKACSPEKPIISAGTGLLTTVDQRDKLMPNLEQPSVYDSVSYWLKQQSLLGLNQQTHAPVNSSTITSGVTSTPVAPVSNDLTTNSRLWNLYQQSYSAQLQTAASLPQPPASPPAKESQPILYQQLAKEEPMEREVNSENELTKEDKPKQNKNRSVLDNLLLNNNTIDCTPKRDDINSLAALEAIEQGEKFLSWLEHCSDPSVTSMQLHVVQTLIKNLKNGLVRKSANQNRNKVRRK